MQLLNNIIRNSLHNKKNSFAILIPTFERPLELERCIRSLLKVKNYIDEVIISDNSEEKSFINTNQKISSVEKALDRDNFMTPEQSLDWGIIDKIIDRRETDSSDNAE